MLTYKVEVTLTNGANHKFEGVVISSMLWEIEQQFGSQISHIVCRRFKKDDAGDLREVDYQGEFV